MSKVWPLVRLGEVLSPIERPVAPVAGNKYRQIGVRLWGEGAYERESIDGSQTNYSTLSRVETNDVIVNKIWARNGSVAVVSNGLSGCYCSAEFPTFQPKYELLEPQWFHWLTKTPPFWQQCDAKSQGTSGKNRIKPEQFLSIVIPLPPLAEQQRIVARIEALAARIAEARGLRAAAMEEIKLTSTLTSNFIFNKKNINTRDTKMSLGNLVDIRAGVTLGRQLTKSTISVPYLRVANVQDGWLDLKLIKEIEVLPEELEKWQLQNGDVLLTEGGDWDKLGRGAIWYGEIPLCIHQNHIFRLRINNPKVIPEFLIAYIRSPIGKEYFQTASKQTTNLASINQKQLKAFEIFCPPLSEQHRIVAYLDSLQAKVDALRAAQEASAAELDALLPAILDKAFRGEL